VGFLPTSQIKGQVAVNLEHKLDLQDPK